MKWIKKHKVLTVILAIVVLSVIGMALGGSGTPSTSNGNGSNNKASSNQKASQTIKVGQAARDGKFEFVVKGVECGKASVGTNQYLTKQAQGQFCLLNVTVKNIGNEPQSLFADNQYLFNAAGQKYSADDTATTYAAPEGKTWYAEINPGNSVEGAIVFDLPKDATPASAELHDSSISGGVKVELK